MMPKAYKPIGTTYPPMTDQQREAARQARNAYLREWRRRNPDLVRAQQERHWARKAEKMAENEGKEAVVDGE